MRGTMPKARALIDGASLGPDALKVVGQVFDEAWREIVGNFNDPLQIEGARLARTAGPVPQSGAR
jgi:hypothetical protein